jgi:hypothetical protein
VSDDSLELNQTCIVGMSSSGKTTFALRYLYNAPVACRFVFDDYGVAARKLGVKPCYTSTELETALASRWVIHNPARMFPGDTKGDGFKFFCQYVVDASKRGNGRKLFLVDELWRWATPTTIPPDLANIAQAGRQENIELVTCTQRPNRINESILGQTTELVVFRLDAPNAIAKIEDISDFRLSSDQIKNLPLGKFISLNRLSGSLLSGSVF